MIKNVYFKKSRRAEYTSRILIFMLVFGALFASALPVSADPLATVSAENITLDENSYAVVGVYANNILSPGLAGYDLDIDYDPLKIQIVGITRSANFSPPTPEFGVNDPNPSPVPGRVTVVNASSSGKQGTFKLFNIKVKALEKLTNEIPFTINVKDFSAPNLVDLTPTLQVPWISDEPTVSADDQNDQIIGLAAGMEYSIDNSAFTPFVSGNLPDLSGYHTVFVRLVGTPSSPPGAEKMLEFTGTLERVSIPQALVGLTAYDNGNSNYIAHGAPIHLTSATPGVTFYYTLGDTAHVPNPSTGDTAYVAATGISIPDGKTIIRVIAVKDGMDASNIATFTFINKVSNPYVIVSGIQYHNNAGVLVSLSAPQGVPVYLGSSTSDVSLYYTTDGNTPTTVASTLYNSSTGIINLPLGLTTLKVLATKTTLANSWTPTFHVNVSQMTVSTAPTVAQISVLNNPIGTNDTVTVHDLHGGDIVKVYADATTPTAIGTGTLPIDQATGSETVIIPQLGTTAGTIYVSVTSPGKSESTRTGIGYVAEAQTNAADVAAGITSITPPASNATSLVMPSVPPGFSIHIKSSSVPSVVSLTGVITPPAIETTVGLVLTVVRISDESVADTSEISVVVPAKTQSIYGAPIQLVVGKGLARPDKITPAKNVLIPINIDSTSFAAGLNAYSFDIDYDPSKVNPTGLVPYTSDNKNGIAVPISLGEITLTDSTHASVHVQWSGNTPVGATYASSKGMLFKVIFTAQTGFVLADAETGIEVTNSNFNLGSNPSNNITSNTGIIYFGMYGDATGDGFITSADTTQIRRYTLTKSSTLTTPARILAADVNNDTFITSADNTQILRYSLSKSSTLTSLFQY